MPERAINYKQYLASREWRVKRKEFKKLKGGICERCAARPIENVHHLTYENIGNEDLNDLMGVCIPCHEYLAAVRDDDPALEIIKSFIDEHGLFPEKSLWKQNKIYPHFISGGLGKQQLHMRFVPEDESIFRAPGQPRTLIFPGIMAIFFWT